MHDSRGWEGPGGRLEDDAPADDASWEWVGRAYAATPTPRPGAAERAAALVASELRTPRPAEAARRRSRRWATAAGVAAAAASVMIALATSHHDSNTSAPAARTVGSTAAPASVPRVSATRAAAPLGAAAGSPPVSRPMTAVDRSPSPAPGAASVASRAGEAGGEAGVGAAHHTTATPSASDPLTSVPAGPLAAAPGEARVYALLRARMADSSVARLRELVAATSSRGLPAAPLLDRAVLGTSRGLSDGVVLAAARSVAARLATARAALGDRSSDAELTAGAEALLGGATPAMLARVRDDRGPGTAVVPLVVLTDLVSNGVAADDAAVAVTSLLRPGAGAQATDEAMLALRAEVAADVARGAAPGAALRSRVRSRAGAAAQPPGPSGPAPGRPPGVRPDQPIPGAP